MSSNKDSLEYGGYSWSLTAPGEENTMLVVETGEVTVTVLKVPCSSLANEENPAEIISGVNKKDLFIVISQEFLQFIKDETNDEARAQQTIGAFLGFTVANTIRDNVKGK